MRHLPSAFVVLLLLCRGPLSAAGCARPAAAPVAEVENARLEVFKAERRLRLYSDDELLREVRVGLGFRPAGHKTRQGDGATPEGDYFVCTKNPQSRYHLSLGISYPNRRDADAGRAAGLLSAVQHREIRRAEERRTCPPWNTPLGGEIFIHGRGSSSDWTLGCIAVDDPHIEELFAAVPVGTPVIIHP